MASEGNPLPDFRHSLPPTELSQDYQDEYNQTSIQYDGERRRDVAIQMATCRNPMKFTKRKGAKAQDSILAVVCKWIVSHQIGLAANLLLLHTLTHICFPRARQRTRKFHLLSYHNPTTGKYALGWDDFYMVCYSIIVLTGLRAATMDYVLVPLAQYAGVKTKKEKVRFSEQAWVVIYDSTMFALGMYIMYTHEHWFNMAQQWTNWPNRELEGSMKWYYLVQFAFWLQQILVVNIEERRKDHWQMFTHHLITCVLMFCSYGYHTTKVGNTILCLMDVVDLFLSGAKILKYLQFQLACDIAFGAFMLVWFVCRHVLYLRVVYSVYADPPREINYGCYSGSNANLTGPFEVDDWAHLLKPFTNPTGIVCWNHNVKMAFVYTLLALQVILLIWFAMIIKVAVKVIKGGEAIDSRSDDEEEEEDDDDEKEKKKPPYQNLDYKDPEPNELPPLEEEVGVEAINLNTQRVSPSRKFRKSGGIASGVTLHSDRKELLGRIGCDKPGAD